MSRSRTGQSQLVNALRRSFQAEIQESIRLVKARAREVDYEVALAKAQADYREQQLQTGERKLASEHRRTLSSFVSRASSEMEEARRWRAELNHRKKSEDSYPAYPSLFSVN